MASKPRRTPGPARVRAAVLVAPDDIAIREFAAPAVGPTTATVAVELCGICGTDLKYASGRLEAPLPLILGHEVVGRIASIGAVAAERYDAAVGDRVLVESSIPCWSCAACRAGAYRLCPTKGGYGMRLSTSVAPGLWGGLAELMFIAEGSIIHRLPPSLSPEAGVGIPLLANGLQWLVHQGGLAPGDRVLIQGCGPQGLAATMAAQWSGASEVVVTGLGSDTARLAFARALGARAEVVDEGETREERLARIGRDFDVVLEVSGAPSAVAGGPAHVRPQGTLVLAGLVGRGRVVDLATDELVWREIRLQGVLSKDDHAFRQALAMVAAEPARAATLAGLTTHVFGLDHALEAIHALDHRLEGFVKAAVRPGPDAAAKAA